MTTETVLTDDDLKDQKINLGVIAPDEFFNKVARAIEQAVLQSPEIQALRKDAGRIRFVADDGCEFNTWIQDDYKTKYRLEWNQGAEWQSEWFDTPEDAIDAAMEHRT